MKKTKKANSDKLVNEDERDVKHVTSNVFCTLCEVNVCINRKAIRMFALLHRIFILRISSPCLRKLSVC